MRLQHNINTHIHIYILTYTDTVEHVVQRMNSLSLQTNAINAFLIARSQYRIRSRFTSHAAAITFTRKNRIIRLVLIKIQVKQR